MFCSDHDECVNTKYANNANQIKNPHTTALTNFPIITPPIFENASKFLRRRSLANFFCWQYPPKRRVTDTEIACKNEKVNFAGNMQAKF